MSWLLGIDTATRRGNLLLARETEANSPWQDVYVRSYEGISDHAERLLGELEHLMGEAQVSPTEIQRIAVGVGPGSFTGVRVGVVTAKALALSWGAQVIPVGALATMAWAFQEAPGPRIAILDARRDELFAAAYDETGSILLPPIHLPSRSLAEWLAPLTQGILLGELDLPLPPGFSWRHSPETDLPGARALGELALRYPPVPRNALEPTYLRPPDALLLTTRLSSAHKSRVDLAQHGRNGHDRA